MKKLFLAAGVVALSACTEPLPTAATSDLSLSYANSSSTSGNKLQCFDGSTEGAGNTGVCTLGSNGAQITTTAGNSYAGVYILNSNLGGKLLSEINKLAFTYSGTGTTGGSPRITFPIDLDGDGAYDDFVSADAIGCTDGTATSGTVNVIDNPTCLVSLNGGATFANFAALIAAYPTARVATDAISFVIVDQPGSFLITNVQLGKGSAKSKS